VKLAMGLLGAFLAFLVVVQLLAQAVLGVGWLFRGQPNFEDYRSRALAYELPDGILASHLGIAGLLLCVLLIQRYWHGRKGGWVMSVQPGGRWRYLLICLVLAAVLLNIVMWLMHGGNMAWQATQPDWMVYLVLIFITSPLQAAAEEFFFRGYLQQAIGSLAGRAWVASESTGSEDPVRPRMLVRSAGRGVPDAGSYERGSGGVEVDKSAPVRRGRLSDCLDEATPSACGRHRRRRGYRCGRRGGPRGAGALRR